MIEKNASRDCVEGAVMYLVWSKSLEDVASDETDRLRGLEHLADLQDEAVTVE